MPARHPRRSRASKAEAVLLADQLNSADEAGKRLGIAGRSIRRWRDDPELAELVLKTREETADDVKVAMVLSWQRIIERLHKDEVETKELITLAGVAFDKHQLATGGATSRSENRELNDLPDSTYVEAIREARRLTSGEGADAPSAEEPAG